MGLSKDELTRLKLNCRQLDKFIIRNHSVLDKYSYSESIEAKTNCVKILDHLIDELTYAKNQLERNLEIWK